MKYYSIAGMRVAMDDGTDLVYFASDHLSSTSISLDNSGTILSEQRYKPFGEVRTDVGTILNPGEAGFTDFGYTGQRNLGDVGLVDYNARFYSPLLGRFIQPDTIIPNPGDSQAWNRYSYTSNNPIKFMDPTGHIAEGACGFQGGDCPKPTPPSCSENPEVCLANNSGQNNGNQNDKNGGSNDPRITDTDIDDDGIPDVPDPFADPVITITHPDPNCNVGELVECFYSRGLLPSGDWNISQYEFNQLMLAVYYDISKRAWSPLDWWERRKYDTPLWDGFGYSVGNICIDNQCYERTEVNYIAQGMYSAKYEGKSIGLLIVEAWNQIEYEHPASEGEKYWFEVGYDFYVAQKWFNYGDPSHMVNK